jgi:hypothetical protein
MLGDCSSNSKRYFFSSPCLAVAFGNVPILPNGANMTQHLRLASALVPHRELLRRFARSRDGVTAAISTLAFTGLVGFVGLGSEAGLWYYTHQTMQGAADSAAVSAAMAMLSGNSAAGITSEGQAAAAQYGLVDGTGKVTVTVNHPPASGAYAGNAAAVEVAIQQPQTALFSALFMANAPTISARSVALQVSSSSGNDCVLALDRGASASTFFNGNTNINLHKCGIAVNSTSSTALSIVGTADLAADSVTIVGSYSVAGGATLTSTHGIATHAASTPDPYAGVALPSFSGCDHSSYSVPSHATVTLNPGVFCSGIKINAQATVTLNPGTYFIDRGALDVAGNATLSGNGVTIVLTSSGGASTIATVAIHGGATINLTAPSSGSLAGLVFFQDRNGIQGTGNDFSGGTTQNIKGAIYLPKETVNFAGGTATGTGCLQIVADEIDFKGNAELEINCTNTGVKPIGAASIKLVE